MARSPHRQMAGVSAPPLEIDLVVAPVDRVAARRSGAGEEGTPGNSGEADGIRPEAHLEEPFIGRGTLESKGQARPGGADPVSKGDQPQGPETGGAAHRQALGIDEERAIEPGLVAGALFWNRREERRES